MLYRDILTTLKNWKERDHHPLIIRGLRQIGKTFIVKAFAKMYYENVVYLDFRSNRLIHKVFDGDFDVNQMILSISASIASARFVEKKTLLIMDEIQDCPNARSSLKYWDLDGRFDVIATGSFLGVKGFRTSYSRGIPVGYEEHLVMYPLTFREFLINVGLDESVFDYVRNCIKQKERVDSTVHESLRKLYLQYLIVGGMPEAVSIFLETHDINQVSLIQRRILNSIKDDFGRTINSKGQVVVNDVLKLRAQACLDSLPSQLSKPYKKFQYSLVNVKGHSPEKAEGLEYLENVGLVVKAFNTRELVYPLTAAKISNEFKVFYIDTGLLVSVLGSDTPMLILESNLGAFKGAIAENMVASEFAKYDKELFYFRDSSGSPELDFLYEENAKVGIIECKATNNRATSMKFVIANKKRFGEHKAIKFADTNIGESEDFTTYPLYAIGFMENEKKSLVIETVNVKTLKV